MCEFALENGETHYETDYSKGWSDFPFKNRVVAVKLKNRIISPKFTLSLSPSQVGFAIHWIGRTVLGGDTMPYMAREIMMVFPTKRVYVCNINLKTGKWHDYSDDLNFPTMPHLHSYDLKNHGM
jgi:hypothetical protein